jgi:hypothetical protein
MRSLSAFRAVVLAAFAVGTAVSPVVAQRSTTRGFTIGGHLQAASLEVQNDDTADDDDDVSSGGGIGVRVGYGFNRRFTGYLETDAIVFDVANPDFGGYWSMVHVDLGLRYNFANSLRRWVPFLEGALGARAVQVDDATVDGDSVGELSFSGGAGSLGGGISFFPTEKLAIEALMKFTGGTFERVDVGNVSVNGLDIEASSFRFKIGVAWWP